MCSNLQFAESRFCRDLGAKIRAPVHSYWHDVKLFLVPARHWTDLVNTRWSTSRGQSLSLFSKYCKHHDCESRVDPPPFPKVFSTKLDLNFQPRYTSTIYRLPHVFTKPKNFRYKLVIENIYSESRQLDSPRMWFRAAAEEACLKNDTMSLASVILVHGKTFERDIKKPTVFFERMFYHHAVRKWSSSPPSGSVVAAASTVGTSSTFSRSFSSSIKVGFLGQSLG